MRQKGSIRDYKRGFDAGRKDIANMIYRQLDFMEQNAFYRQLDFMEQNALKIGAVWDIDDGDGCYDSGLDIETLDARTVISDLRKIIKMYL